MVCYNKDTYKRRRKIVLKRKAIFIILLAFFMITTNVQALTIVLDPGHGGIDSGAVSGNIYESNVTLKIAQYLREYLQEYEGVSVSLTHEGIASGEVTVFDRTIMARDRNADLLVSLHINSSTSSSANGAEVYVTANTSLDKYNKETTELGNRILANLASLGIANRGVLTKVLSTDTTDRYSDGTMADYYGIIRYAMRGTKIDYGVIWPTGKEPANIQNGEGVPAILVEHCFLSSSKDRAYLDSDEDLKKLAKADADAIVAHYGLQKKSEQLKEENGILTRISEKTTKEQLNNKLQQLEIAKTCTFTIEQEGQYIGTGTKVKAIEKSTGKTKEEYQCIVFGDTNGDGKITAADYVLIKNHIMEGNVLTDELKKTASDVNRDSKTTAADYVLIKNHIMNGTAINIE